MRKIFILLTFLISSAIADEWFTITPLPSCEQMSLQYQITESGKYNIRYLSSPDNDQYTYYPKPIEDINNLIDLNNILSEIEFNYCPLSDLSLQEQSDYICEQRQNPAPLVLSEDYSNLIKDIFDIANNEKSCDDVAPIIELQSRITNLSNEELIKFNKHRGILNIFTGSENDKLLDHYYTCAGRKGSDKFIKNMIMIEAYNACIIPGPQGLMSYDSALKIAEEIGESYKGLGVLGLVKKQDTLIHEVVGKFLDQIIIDQGSSLLGSSFNAEELKTMLPSIQNFYNIGHNKTLDYTMNIIAIDTPLELVDRALPEIISHNVGPLVKDLLSKEQTEEFLSEFSPMVNNDYQQCIASAKERVNFNKNTTLKAKIKHRKNLAKRFCDLNPETCNGRRCEGKTNILTDDPKTSDFNIIQACILEAINNNLDSLIASIIEGQASEMEDLLVLSSTNKNSIASDTKEIILGCANQTFNTKHQMIMPEVLKYIDATEYSDTLGACTPLAEKKIVTDIAVLALSQMDTLIELTPIRTTSQFHGTTVNGGTLVLSKGLVNSALNSCIKSQEERGMEYSSTLCLPAIEMKVASHVIQTSLEKSLEQIPFDKKNIISTKFSMCKNLAELDFHQAVNNENHHFGVLDSEDASNFLKDNNNFYNCAKTALNEAAVVTIDNLLEEQEKDLKEQLSDFDYFLSIKDELKRVPTECIKEEIDSIPNWPAFMEYMDKDGLAETQVKCEQISTEFALTKLINNEISNQIENLRGINLTNIDLENITANIADHYDVDLRLSSSENKNEVIIAKAYRKFQKKNPDVKLEVFIDSLVVIATDSVISNLHNRLTERVILLGKSSEPAYDFSDFKDKLTDGCLSEIYEHHKDNIEKLIDDISKVEGVPEKEEETDFLMLFVDFIYRGLGRAKAVNQYDEYLTSLNNLCANPTKQSDIDGIIRTGIADHIILAQVEKQTVEAFNDLASSQCYEVFNSTISLVGAPFENLCDKRNISNLEKRQIQAYFTKSSRFSSQQKNIISFALARMFKTQKLTRDYLDSKNLKEVLQNDKEVMSLIYDNLTEVAAGHPPTMGMLTKKLVSTLFEDRTKDSFASKFVESQLIAGIGISGYEIASQTIKDKLNSYIIRADFVEEKAIDSLHRKWNNINLSNILNWDAIDETSRNGLIDAVFAHAVIPTVDVETTEGQKEVEFDKLVVHLTEHLSDYPSAKNPDYKSAREVLFFSNLGTPYWVEIGPEGDEFISVADRMTKDITSETFADIMKFWD